MIAAKQTEDTYLGEEVKRYWSECTEQNYLFDRLEKEVGCIELPTTCTIISLREPFTQVLLFEDERKKNLKGIFVLFCIIIS